MSKDKNKRTLLVQSTQQNIPIKDIVNGIIVTKDNSYVKIMEIKPIPFYLKTISERNLIYDNFARLLKSGPNDIQIKIVSLSTDLSAQLDILNKEIEDEKNNKCIAIDEEYKEQLYDSQANGITRRFFIIFSQKAYLKIGKKTSPLEIINDLENQAATIENILKNCGNSVVKPRKEDANKYIAKLLYILLNRDKYQDETFEKHLDKVYQKYFEVGQNTNVYIPPNDYIAPNKITFSDKKYVTVDNMYYRYAYIPKNGYKQYLTAGWANLFSNTFIGVDVDIFLKRIDKQQIMSSLRRNLSYSLVEADDASITSEAYDNAGQSISSAVYLKNGLSGSEDFYYVSTIVSACDENIEYLDYKVEELMKSARSNDFKLKQILFEGENAFKSTLPLCNLDKTLYEKTKRNMLTEGAATAYPFTAFEINDEDGVYVGVDQNTGSLAVIDVFNTKKITNSNIFICGQPGAGKTYTLLLLATRMRIKHIPVFIIAPEKQNEIKRLCNAVGGQFLEFGPGSNSRINVMEIFKKDAKAEARRARIDGVHNDSSQLAEKADAVKKFIQLIVGNITKEQEGLLSEAIFETYEKFGITRDNNSLWADENKTYYKKMPILSNLCETLLEISERQPSLKSVYNILNSFVKTNGATYNGETNVDVNNEFVVFGLEKLNEEDIAIGVYLTMDYCWSKIKQDSTKRKALFIDEWWRMAKNKIAADYSQEISKIIRAYRGSMVIATQQMQDIMLSGKREIGEAVLENCSMKILMKMGQLDASSVQEIMNLSEEETDEIVRNEKGCALLIYGTDKMQIKFIATKTEDELITTDPKQLEQLAKDKELLEIRGKAMEMLKNAKDISDILQNNYQFKIDDCIEMYDIDKLFNVNIADTYTLVESKKYLEEEEIYGK